MSQICRLCLVVLSGLIFGCYQSRWVDGGEETDSIWELDPSEKPSEVPQPDSNEDSSGGIETESNTISDDTSTSVTDTETATVEAVSTGTVFVESDMETDSESETESNTRIDTATDTITEANTDTDTDTAVSFAPCVQPSFPSVSGRYRDAQIVDDILYVAAGSAGIRMYSADAKNVLGEIFTHMYSAHLRVWGDEAFVFTSGSPSYMEVLDISDPFSAQMRSYMVLPTYPRDVETVQGMLFLALYDELMVVDVQTLDAPLIAAEIPIDNVKDMTIQNGYLYAASTRGIEIVDVSDPMNPNWMDDGVVLLESDTPQDSVLDAEGDYLFAAVPQESSATPYSELHLYDISLPEVPVWLGMLNQPDLALQLSVTDQVARMAMAGGGLYTTNLFESEMPFLLSPLSAGEPVYSNCVSGMATCPLWSDGKLFSMRLDERVVDAEWSYPGNPEHIAVAQTAPVACVSEKNSFFVMDISDPNRLSVIRRVEMEERIGHLTASGDTLFIKVNNQGLFSFEMSSAMNAEPVYLGYAENNITRIEKVGTYWVAVDDRYELDGVRYDALHILNFDSGSLLKVGELLLDGSPTDMRAHEDRVFLSRNTGFIEVVDVGDPFVPKFVSEFEPTSVAYSGGPLARFDHYLYAGVHDATEGVDGILILDIASPADIKEVGFIPQPYHTDLYTFNDRLYVRGPASGVGVYDLSTPWEPIRLGRHLVSEDVTTIDVTSTHLLVGARSYGVRIVDMDAPLNQGPLSYVNFTHSAAPVSVADDLLVAEVRPNYIDAASTIRRLDMGNPQQPVETGVYQTDDGQVTAMAIQDGVAYLSEIYNPGSDSMNPGRLTALDLRDTDRLKAIERLEFDEPLDDVEAGDGFVAAMARYDKDEGSTVLRTFVVQEDGSLVLGGEYPIYASGLDMALDGSNVWVAGRTNGLSVFKIQGDGSPSFIAQYTIGEGALDIDIDNRHRAAVSNGGPTVRLLDVSNVEVPKLLAEIAFDGGIAQAKTEENRLYAFGIIQGSSVIQIWDIEVLDAPSLVGTIPIESEVDGFEVMDNGMIVTTSFLGTAVYDSSLCEGLR